MRLELRMGSRGHLESLDSRSRHWDLVPQAMSSSGCCELESREGPSPRSWAGSRWVGGRQAAEGQLLPPPKVWPELPSSQAPPW